MNQWQTFFNGYAPDYNAESFTKNTEREVAFLLEELQLPSGAAVLDLGCGTGRHSLGLARYGLRMTGVDISREMLRIAEAARDAQGLDIRFVCSDALDYQVEAAFDAAICLCEGALCLLGADDDPLERDLRILRNVHQALKPGARFVVNVLNGCRLLRAISDEDLAAGKYDLLNMVEHTQMEIDGPQGKRSIDLRERGYTPPEFKRILQLAGFRVEQIYGGTAGAWNRQLPRLDEMELMAITVRNRP